MASSRIGAFWHQWLLAAGGGGWGAGGGGAEG
jgi:hypothetical protein